MTLSSYLTSLVLVASVCALTAALAPEGSNKKYLHLLASVAVLVALLSPLSQLDLSFDAEGQEPLPSPEGEHLVVAATEEALREALCEALSLSQEEVCLSLSASCDAAGNVTLSSLTLTLVGEGTAKREAARAYLEKNLPKSCEVFVYVEPYHQ